MSCCVTCIDVAKTGCWHQDGIWHCQLWLLHVPTRQTLHDTFDIRNRYPLISCQVIGPGNVLQFLLKLGCGVAASDALCVSSSMVGMNIKINCYSHWVLQSLMLMQKRRSLIPRPSLGGLSSALTGLSVSKPEDQQHQTPVACCQGNWLSHLDWDGQRCTLLTSAPETCSLY